MEPVKKTWKRETALGLLTALAALFVWGLVAERPDIVEVGKYLTFPVFLFAGGAFGIEAMSQYRK